MLISTFNSTGCPMKTCTCWQHIRNQELGEESSRWCPSSDSELKMFLLEHLQRIQQTVQPGHSWRIRWCQPTPWRKWSVRTISSEVLQEFPDPNHQMFVYCLYLPKPQIFLLYITCKRSIHLFRKKTAHFNLIIAFSNLQKWFTIYLH